MGDLEVAGGTLSVEAVRLQACWTGIRRAWVAISWTGALLLLVGHSHVETNSPALATRRRSCIFLKYLEGHVPLTEKLGEE